MPTQKNKKLITISIFFFLLVLVKFTKITALLIPEPATVALTNSLIDGVLWLLAAAIVNNFVQRLLRAGKKEKDVEHGTRGFIFDFVAIVIYLVAIAAIIGFVFGESITGFWILILGVTLILGLLLRTELFRLFPSLSFDFRKPIQVGDWIRVNANVYTPQITGKIIDMNRKSIFVLCESNTVTIVPTKLLDDLITTNYKGPEYRTKFEITFNIDFSVPVERAKRVLLAGALQAIEGKGFLKQKQPEVLISKTGPLGIEYTVSYWINPWKSLTPAQARDTITTTILKHLSKSGLSLAYPKEDVYYKEMPVRQIDATSIIDRKAILSKIELFQSFDEDELEYLSNNIVQEVFLQEQEIVTTGAKGNSMFILVEGLCDVYAINEEGEKINVGQISPGQYFGEMSLLTGEPRSATVVADTECFVYIITKEHIEKIFNKRPATVEAISDTVADRRMKTTQTIRLTEQNKETLVSQILEGIKQFFSID
jgi:CRP-like cAMP-binding protein/small-conductance mechanosensitive channel